MFKQRPPFQKLYKTQMRLTDLRFCVNRMDFVEGKDGRTILC